MYFHFSKVERECFLFFVYLPSVFFLFFDVWIRNTSFWRALLFQFVFVFLDCVPEETPETFDSNCINSSPARREPDDL